MYIAMVSAECAPIAKAGGLGDFVQGLARELSLRGNQVEVFLPKYDCLRFECIQGMTQVYRDLWVPYYDQSVRCDVEYGEVDALKCYFIVEHARENFFGRGKIYGEPDDPHRFAFFCRAVLEFMLKSDRHPDVIHCHDWQTGLVPVLLYEVCQGLGLTHTRACYTLHNMGHQGVVDESVLRQVGLKPDRLMTMERLLDPGNPQAANLIKGGIVFANFVTTVSPRYAWEIEHTDQGMGLQGLLQQYDRKFGGVLNGIDYTVWNPESDTHLPATYGPDTLPQKALSKKALRERLGLEDAAKPILAVVSRLDRQKGVDLIRRAIYFALESGCQFVLLGSAPEPAVNDQFWRIKRELESSPDCHLELGYDEELAHLIYGGADMILIPSVYEPCGLTQMIAMKYGMVPIVRRVGGLADTVFDANYSDKPFEERNGYVFDELTEAAMEAAMGRAIGLWFRFPEYFSQLRVNGMRADNSWNKPGQQYLDIYHHLRG
ncbi:glycogen synthase [uncultured Thiodictyon sp.]|uniref:glycogen synthase n=1 Tax=uncultured Thiodictyon sp. TaxID=1846217 RepID=UPI0026008740|nr:glycogen synthase [uncultured Thiodictyon sp.]